MIHLLLALIYLAFISLGLPDAVLGAAWPVMHQAFGVNISSMGIVTMIIALGTIISSLQSDRLMRAWGAHKITVVSVFVTAIALLGFSLAPSFGVLCLWAIPYGLGAGSVDTALNNYVAIHFESRHMSWLHCMWGLGASTGPSIMALALQREWGYHGGYQILFAIQLVLTLCLFASRPVWQQNAKAEETAKGETQTLGQVLTIPGMIPMAACFFCFCTIEHTAGIWASTYLVQFRGLAETQAAGFGALVYLGITVGRVLSGFATIRFSDVQMIRAGMVMIGCGIAVLLLPLGTYGALGGLLLVGFGAAPVFPCIIHATPDNFGIANSQAATGVQMAAAYTGTLTMPALFGVLARTVGFWLYPFFLLTALATMAVLHIYALQKMHTQP